MLFSFVEGGFSLPRVMLGYVPGRGGGWIGKSHMVLDAYLFILKIHANNFGTGW
jgi:hypothetical protein